MRLSGESEAYSTTIEWGLGLEILFKKKMQMHRHFFLLENLESQTPFNRGTIRL